MTRVSRWIAPLVVLLGMSLTGVAAGADLAAAKKEGTLNLYGGAGLNIMQPLAKAFEARYGIKVEITRNGSERNFQRILQEAEQRINHADVVITADEAHFVVFKQKGLLAQYRSPLDERVPETFRDADRYYYTPFGYRYGIMYNTKLIPPDQAPKSYAELADPRWKDKLVHGHPGYSGGVMHMVALLSAKLGRQYYEGLARNRPLIVQSILDVATHVISGERPVAAGAIYYDVFLSAQKGNPVGFVFPTEGNIFVASPFAVMKDAPHPNAARLFIDWVLDTEAQGIFAGLATDAFDPNARYPEGFVPADRDTLWKADASTLPVVQIKDMFRRLFGV